MHRRQRVWHQNRPPSHRDLGCLILLDWLLMVQVICLWRMVPAVILLKLRQTEYKAPLPPGCHILLDWPSKANRCPCLNPRLWGCWPSAPSHSSFAAAATWPPSLDKNGGRRIVAVNQSGKTRIGAPTA